MQDGEVFCGHVPARALLLGRYHERYLVESLLDKYTVQPLGTNTAADRILILDVHGEMGTATQIKGTGKCQSCMCICMRSPVAHPLPHNTYPFSGGRVWLWKYHADGTQYKKPLPTVRFSAATASHYQVRCSYI
jgi:hypothetical protein